MAATALPPIGPADPLGREVFSQRDSARAAKGNVPHKAFLEKPGVDVLSLDRLDLAPDIVVAQIADKNAERRHQTFYGWAVVSAEHAATNGRTVRAVPRPDNPYHAEIQLNISQSSERRDVEKQHALELAAAASWRGRPS